MLVLAALLGGAWAESSFGAAAGALLAWLLLQLRRQAARIAALERAAPGLQPALQPVLQPAPQPAPQTGALQPAPGESVDAEPRPAAARAASAVPVVSSPALPAPAAPATPATSATPPPRLTPDPLGTAAAAAREAAAPDAWTTARQWLLGGNTIAKLGVAILFVGLAFLAKYAAEHTQVPVELRLAGIGAVALVLLALGWRLRGTRPAYAQALQGGAVAVLYLTLFVAFRFYGVIGIGPVFALMVLVAALAAALAVLQDARPLAVIGALGGFATPLLVSSGSGDHVALFGYYLVLDLGIAAVAWFRTWRLLNLIGFVFTFAVGSVWGVTQYSAEHYASSQAFLIAYFLLFNAVMLMPARSGRASRTGATARSDGWVNGSLLFGLPIIVFGLQHGLVREMPFGTSLSALVLAAFYVLMAMRLRRHAALSLVFDGSLAVAIVFLSLTLPFALDASSTAGAWALEGAGLVWLGWRQRRRLPRAFGYTLLLLAAAALLLASDRLGQPTAVFNAVFLNALLLSAGALAAAFFVARAPAGLAAGVPVHASTEASGDTRADPAADTRAAWMPGEAAAQPVLIGLGTLAALAAVAVQVGALVRPPYELAGWLVGLGAVALLLTLLSRGLRWPGVAQPAMGLAPLLAVLVAASAATPAGPAAAGGWVSPAAAGGWASPAAAGGWWAWPLALAVQGLVLAWAAPRWPAPAQRGVHALGVLVLAALGALQGRALTAGWGDDGSAWAWLGWLVVPAALLWLLPRAPVARLWPVRAAPDAYQGLAAALLTLALLLWALLANVFSDGSAQPLPHVPLLNPLDLGVALALGACALWLRSAPAQAAIGNQPQTDRAVWAVLGASGFVWLNAMLVRGFHHYGGVPHRLDSWLQSLPVQTGLTLLWSALALALMWLSARRALRLPWLVGAGLLAAVVLKLVLVDLSGSGSVTRIVSFIGVGLLMLVIAYVAPLPGAQAASGKRPAP